MSYKTSDEAHRQVVDDQERNIYKRNHTRAGKKTVRKHARRGRRRSSRSY